MLRIDFFSHMRILHLEACFWLDLKSPFSKGGFRGISQVSNPPFPPFLKGGCKQLYAPLSISESPSIVEEEVQKGSCQYAKDIGKKIINVQDFGQKPQDRYVRKQSRAGKDMILKHPFKIF